MKNLLSLPNFFTILRFILTIEFLILFLKNKFLLASIILAISSITDFLDGFLARILKQKTAIGSFLDAFVDKMLIITTIIALASKNLIPLWFFTIIIARETLVSAGWIITYQRKLSFSVKPRFLGKVSIVLETITMTIVILNVHLKEKIIFDMLNEMFFITALFVIGSFIDYIIFARRVS
ncbi:MAG: CDP-alcohol phosphatidyltransferase family protein [Endomicrobiia bacterium]